MRSNAPSAKEDARSIRHNASAGWERQHTAVVDIRYTTKSYSVTREESDPWQERSEAAPAEEKKSDKKAAAKAV